MKRLSVWVAVMSFGAMGGGACLPPLPFMAARLFCAMGSPKYGGFAAPFVVWITTHPVRPAGAVVDSTAAG